MDRIFNSIYDSVNQELIALNWGNLLICSVTALFCGAMIALFFALKNKRYNKNFLFALIGAPVFIAIIISIASRNVGITLSIAGVFTLVRFRSDPINGRELTNILATVAVGITAGCGFIAYAVIAALFLSIFNLVFNLTKLGSPTCARQLRITIPESLDYAGVFDDIFEKYTSQHTLIRVKSTSMGALFQLTYNITEKDECKEKEMLDEIRCRNGNLDIICIDSRFLTKETL